MSFNIITREVNARAVTIKLVDGSIIHGKINLHRNGVDIGRVSDFLTKVNEPFLVVFDATEEEKVGMVLIINKSNIVWVLPEDKPRQADKLPQEEGKPREASGGSLLDRLRST
jgi:small nuclear ribonucleoprotein (snRNP)-like protein